MSASIDRRQVPPQIDAAVLPEQNLLLKFLLGGSSQNSLPARSMLVFQLRSAESISEGSVVMDDETFRVLSRSFSLNDFRPHHRLCQR